MIEILISITELLLDSVKSYSDSRDSRRKREFGQAIATCYFRLIEIYYTGHIIVGRLESFEQMFRERAKDGWRHRHDSLVADLEKQSLNLIRLGHAIQKVSKELYILAPETALKLATLVRSKENAIAELAYSLQSGKVPLEFVVANKKIGESHQDLLSIDPNKSEKETQKDFDFLSFLLGSNTEIKSEYISTRSDWENDVYLKVNHYLKINKPRERLSELEEFTDKLRKLMIEHFALEDILWSVDKFHDDTRYLF